VDRRITVLFPIMVVEGVRRERKTPIPTVSVEDGRPYRYEKVLNISIGIFVY